MQGANGRTLGRRCRKYGGYYLLLLPTLAFFVIFRYLPMYGVVIAFQDYGFAQGVLASPWVGFKHFQRLFTSAIFQRALLNTLIISFQKLVLAFPLPIAFALLLNEVGHKGFKKAVQTLSYLPFLMSWVVLAGIIYNLLSLSNGSLNWFIAFFGGAPRHFLGEPGSFRAIVFVSYVWQTLGYNAVVYLAAMSGIDVEQYAAASIDGANRFQKMRFVTLPALQPTILIMFVLGIGGVMNAGFDQIFNLYNPVTYSTGDIIDTYAYRVGLIDYQYSFSAAVGFFQNAVGLVLVLVTNGLSRRLDDEHALFS